MIPDCSYLGISLHSKNIKIHTWGSSVLLSWRWNNSTSIYLSFSYLFFEGKLSKLSKKCLPPRHHLGTVLWWGKQRHSPPILLWLSFQQQNRGRFPCLRNQIPRDGGETLAGNQDEDDDVDAWKKKNYTVSQICLPARMHTCVRASREGGGGGRPIMTAWLNASVFTNKPDQS